MSYESSSTPKWLMMTVYVDKIGTKMSLWRDEWRTGREECGRARMFRCEVGRRVSGTSIDRPATAHQLTRMRLSSFHRLSTSLLYNHLKSPLPPPILLRPPFSFRMASSKAAVVCLQSFLHSSQLIMSFLPVRSQRLLIDQVPRIHRG